MKKLTRGDFTAAGIIDRLLGLSTDSEENDSDVSDNGGDEVADASDPVVDDIDSNDNVPETVYGPPEWFDPVENEVQDDYGPPPEEVFYRPEGNIPKLLYGPPSSFGFRPNDTIYGPPEWFMPEHDEASGDNDVSSDNGSDAGESGTSSDGSSSVGSWFKPYKNESQRVYGPPPGR